MLDGQAQSFGDARFWMMLIQKQYLNKIPRQGRFVRVYSCHFKGLSYVISWRQTVTARRKYVSYCTRGVQRPRQGQYGIHKA